MSADATDTANRLTLTLEVADTGIGIAPQDQVRIFDPFVRAGNKDRQKGTGLGLAITRAFVELMGGRLGLKTTPGIGSVFRIELPVEESDEKTALAAPEGERKRVVGLAPGQPDYRVLIVEDQEENWILLERILQTVGFQVRVAQDGEQASAVFSSWRPHFIWMDLGLPGIDGVEATRRIRNLEGGSEVRIVALSASASVSQRDSVLIAGLDDFLRKPYRSEELFDCMSRLLGVQYLYETKEPGAAPNPALAPGSLAALSQELRDELSMAVLRLEPRLIEAAIGRVSGHDAILAGVLKAYADQFAYSRILTALREVNVGQSSQL